MTTPRLLVFAKAPVPGAAKRRLIPALGAEGAAALHARLVRRTLAVAAQSGIATELWCAPDTAHPFFAQCAKKFFFSVALFTQRGADLGARMHAALSDALTRADLAVVIGCDCPEMKPEHLHAAFAALATHDAVLGPAEDGGYWLIGLRRPQPGLFTGIAWGGDTVLAMTRARLAAGGLRWHELETLHDIDRPKDLARLPAEFDRDQPYNEDPWT